METEEPKKKHKLLNIILFLMLSFVVLIMYSRYLGTKGLVVKEYRISSNNLPLSFSGVKIVHISDLYIKNKSSISNLGNIVEKANILKPDIVIFTGNLLDTANKLNETDYEKISSLLNSLHTTIGKYAVKGKRDYNQKYDNIIANSGFKVLNNESDIAYYKSNSPIFIGGLDCNKPDIASMYEYYISNSETDIQKAEYKIILTSKGDYAEKLINNDATVNLILAGNSLNGGVVLPVFGGLFIPEGSKKYYAPYYKVGATEIYISSGIGTDRHPYRLFNKPSFNFYRMKSL